MLWLEKIIKYAVLTDLVSGTLLKGRRCMTEQEMIRAILAHTEYLKENHLPYEGFEIIQTKWCGRILLELCQKTPLRFGEIKKAVPEISNAVLASALKVLAEHGLVERKQFNEIPPHVEYGLTAKGRGMLTVIYEMICWEERFASYKIASQEV